MGFNVTVTQGPKLRVGSFQEGKVRLKEGQLFTFDQFDVPGSQERVKLPHPEILNTLAVGDVLLLDDGKLRMEVVGTKSCNGTVTGEVPLLPVPVPPLVSDVSVSSDAVGATGTSSVTCRVVIGGPLSNRKGVNTPSVVLPISPFTAKDKRFVLNSTTKF
jgi:pyruvate kinase